MGRIVKVFSTPADLTALSTQISSMDVSAITDKSTEADMTAFLLATNKNKFIRYTGETTANYIQNQIYQIIITNDVPSYKVVGSEQQSFDYVTDAEIEALFS